MKEDVPRQPIGWNRSSSRYGLAYGKGPQDSFVWIEMLIVGEIADDLFVRDRPIMSGYAKYLALALTPLLLSGANAQGARICRGMHKFLG